MKYILDTNVYISAYLTYYNPDICSSYWDVLKELGENGFIHSPKQVKEELVRKDDLLSKWSKSGNPCFFTKDMEGIATFFVKAKEAYKEIKALSTQQWQKKIRNYKLKEESISDEDMFVVATALFYKQHFPNEEVVIVTKETRTNHPNKPVRIPHLCDKLNVRCIDDFEFLKEVGVKMEATCEIES